MNKVNEPNSELMFSTITLKLWYSSLELELS